MIPIILAARTWTNKTQRIREAILDILELCTVTGALHCTVKNKCNYIPGTVAAELPSILVKRFNCFKSYVLFDCIGRVNYNNNNRYSNFYTT